MPNMKQETLSFASAKRTNAISKGKLGNVRSKRVEAKNDGRASEVYEISSDDEGSTPAAVKITVPAKRTRAGAKKRASSGTTPPIPVQPSDLEKLKSREIERVNLDVDDKAGHYRRYYNEVRSRMGHIPPVHSEGQNKIHLMLRFFDMSYEFGPCIGMTRLERWERAEAFGLNPPVEVRDILLTKEGVEKPEYARCVLDTEV